MTFNEFSSSSSIINVKMWNNNVRQYADIAFDKMFERNIFVLIGRSIKHRLYSRVTRPGPFPVPTPGKRGGGEPVSSGRPTPARPRGVRVPKSRGGNRPSTRGRVEERQDCRAHDWPVAAQYPPDNETAVCPSLRTVGGGGVVRVD